MRTSMWIAALWLGLGLLILLLPFIMSSWTSFSIALALAVLVIWKAFRPGSRAPRTDHAASPLAGDADNEDRAN